MNQDDAARREAIMNTNGDDREFARLLFDYYHDADRAGRTSRSTLYLHIGMACGVIMRLLPK